jgi:hypothetical protein
MNGLATAWDGAVLAGTTNGQLVSLDSTTGAGTQS